MDIEKYKNMSIEYIEENYTKDTFNKTSLLMCKQIEDEALLYKLAPYVSMYILLKYQKLSASFIKSYILNPENHSDDYERNLDVSDVLGYQKHLEESELLT